MKSKKKTETYFNAKNAMEICVYTDLAISTSSFFSSSSPKIQLYIWKVPALYHSPLIKQK
jgi:hypothetical protein